MKIIGSCTESEKPNDCKCIGCWLLWLCSWLGVGWDLVLLPGTVRKYLSHFMSLEKDKDSKCEVWSLPNSYNFCTIVKSKTRISQGWSVYVLNACVKLPYNLGRAVLVLKEYMRTGLLQKMLRNRGIMIFICLRNHEKGSVIFWQQLSLEERYLDKFHWNRRFGLFPRNDGFQKLPAMDNSPYLELH